MSINRPATGGESRKAGFYLGVNNEPSSQRQPVYTYQIRDGGKNDVQQGFYRYEFCGA